MGIADTAVILLSALVKVFVRLRSEHRIKKMAEFTDEVNILRDGAWQVKSTSDLVPGDVFEVAEGKTTPVDAVILNGNIVADESSLTGEPLPIRKFPLRADDPTPYDRIGAGKTSTIFAGTTISQAERTEQDIPVCALVTNTGTGTDKGELVKKILFPTRVAFVFDEQIKIVILILLACGLVCLALAIWLYAKGTSAWFYAMFAIAQLVSPLLPAALVVGQSVAAGRLRDQHIFCVGNVYATFLSISLPTLFSTSQWVPGFLIPSHFYLFWGSRLYLKHKQKQANKNDILKKYKKYL